MDEPPVVRKVASWDGNDIEAHCTDLLNFSRADRARSFSQARLGAENSAKGGGGVCRCSTDQDGDAWWVEVGLVRLENEVALGASASPVNAAVASVRAHTVKPQYLPPK